MRNIRLSIKQFIFASLIIFLLSDEPDTFRSVYPEPDLRRTEGYGVCQFFYVDETDEKYLS